MTELITGSALIIFGLGCFFRYEMIVSMVLMVLGLFGLEISMQIDWLKGPFKIIGIGLIIFGVYPVYLSYIT